MERQKSLTRTNSSLLRSSPTIRSSIHSLSSVSEIAADEETWDIEEQKPHNKPVSQSALSYFLRVTIVILFSVCTFFAFFTRSNTSTSERLLLALIFIAVLLYFIAKNKALVNRVQVCKQLCGQRSGVSFISTRTHSEPVEWFIGGVSSHEMNQHKNVHSAVKEGVELASNGDFYEGEFHKGRCSGSGVYYYFANGRYEGDWIDGRYDGFGIESWERGSRYRGQYKQGSRHGFGIYKFYTGDSYAGEWSNGQSHGIGSQTCADGSFYFGEFKCGVKHGLGCYNFRNGDRYIGEYFGDKMHGFGVYNFVNGQLYEGSWHEGRKQGYGMYVFRSGDTKCGEWHKGELKVPLSEDSDLVIRGVQAARTIMEKANKLQRIDEQVNKAVVAANKAATAARVAAIKAVQIRMKGKYCSTSTMYMMKSRH